MESLLGRLKVELHKLHFNENTGYDQLSTKLDNLRHLAVVSDLRRSYNWMSDEFKRASKTISQLLKQLTLGQAITNNFEQLDSAVSPNDPRLVTDDQLWDRQSLILEAVKSRKQLGVIQQKVKALTTQLQYRKQRERLQLFQEFEDIVTHTKELQDNLYHCFQAVSDSIDKCILYFLLDIQSHLQQIPKQLQSIADMFQSEPGTTISSTSAVIKTFYEREESRLSVELNGLKDDIGSNVGIVSETLVKSFLESHLKGFHFLNGIVIDSNGRKTNEMDIIITDGNAPCFPAGRGESSFHRTPIETVVGIVEVKSAASRLYVEDAVKKKFTIVRQMKTMSSQLTLPLTALVMGGNAYVTTADIQNWLNDCDPENVIDFVGVIGCGYVVRKQGLGQLRFGNEKSHSSPGSCLGMLSHLIYQQPRIPTEDLLPPAYFLGDWDDTDGVETLQEAERWSPTLTAAQLLFRSRDPSRYATAISLYQLALQEKQLRHCQEDIEYRIEEIRALLGAPSLTNSGIMEDISLYNSYESDCSE